MAEFFGPKRTSVILAADLPTLDENLSLLDRVAGSIDVIKIGSPLVYRESVTVIRRLVDRYSIPVFADLKVADVPHTNAKIVAMVRDCGGSAVMVHGFIGPDGLEDCIREADGKLGLIVQLELTSPGGLLFTQPIADEMAAVSSLSPIYGVQAPGNRPERIAAIRQIVGPERVIVCCGVGFQGGQYREILHAGGDYAIIGRAVYLAADPLAALQELLQPRPVETGVEAPRG